MVISVQKSITGDMPEDQKSFLDKFIGDEIEVKGVKYTAISIGEWLKINAH